MVKSNTLLLVGAAALAALYILPQQNAGSSGGSMCARGNPPSMVSAGTASQAQVSAAVANSVPAAQSQSLLTAAIQNGNIVELQRAIGQMALAAGNPIGVNSGTANFIQGTAPSSSPTSNPANYIQTGGAIRYVGGPSAGNSIGGGVF